VLTFSWRLKVNPSGARDTAVIIDSTRKRSS